MSIAATLGENPLNKGDLVKNLKNSEVVANLSVGNLQMEIFCFDPKADYEFYFKKLALPYTQAKPSGAQISTTQNLSEVLDLIENTQNISVYQNLPQVGTQNQQTIALKINGIALLGDEIGKEKVGNLLARFGAQWRIEPLSMRYVAKDLRLDMEAMKSRYDEILEKWEFVFGILSGEDKQKLYEFLLLNAVSERNDEYLGDGFFAFASYVAKNHTEHLEKILESISQNGALVGVLEYASIQNLLYKPNPQIDMDIEWLISVLLSQKCCEPMIKNLIKTSKNHINHQIDCQKNFIDFLDSSDLSESKNVGKKETKYILFDGYDTRYIKQSSALITSCEKLCERLSIPLSKKENMSFVYNGGHFARIYDLHLFIERTMYNVWQVMAKGYTLLFGDYASFCEAKFALEMNLVLSALKNAKSNDTKSNKMLDAKKLTKSLLDTQNLINQHPKKDALQACLKQEPIAYIGDLLEGNLDSLDFSKSAKINNLPNALNIVAYTPNVASTLESRLDNASYLAKLAQTINALNTKSAIKLDLLDIIAQDFSHLKCLESQFDCRCYLEESAKIRFFGIDLGAEVLLVDSIEQFYTFGKKATQSAKAYNRDMDSTEAMFLPQLALKILDL